MHRPDHVSADPNACGAGKAGFTDGNPAALPPIPPTKQISSHMNDLGESLCRVPEHVGIALVKGDYDQAWEAVEAHTALALHSNWAAKTNDGSYADDFFAAIWTGSDFVIAGQTGEIQSSPEGHTWTTQASASGHTQTFRGACIDATKVYLCSMSGSNGRIDERLISGGSWNGYYVAVSGHDFYAIAHDGTDLLAVGEDESPGNVPFVLRNGSTFDVVAGGGSSQRFVDICVGDGGEFVVLGRTAANGFEVLKYVASEWVVVGSGSQTVDRIAWSEAFGLYTIVGGGSVLTSPTGATWQTRSTPFTTGTSASITQWRHVLYVTSSTGQVGRSLNGGVTWTRIRHDAAINSARTVAANDKRLVAAGDSGVIAASLQFQI